MVQPIKNPIIRVLTPPESESNLQEQESSAGGEVFREGMAVRKGRKPVFMARRRIPREEAATQEPVEEKVAETSGETKSSAARIIELEAVAKEQAAKEQAAKEQAAKEQVAKEQAAKEQAAKEQAAKEQVAKEQVAKEQVAREQVAREQADEGKRRWKDEEPWAMDVEEKPVTTRAPQRISKRLKRNLLVLSGAVAGAVLVTALVVYPMGRNQGYQAAEQDQKAREIKGGAVEVPDEANARLDAALLDLRDGKADVALKELQDLKGEFPYAPSLSYLVAVAALQAGDLALAETAATESIAKGERVSDSLALQSVVVSQKSRSRDFVVMGNPKERAAELLRKAAHADAANPYPHMELSTLLRYQGKREEAVAELKAAQARLNPVDSHLLMNITFKLLNYEQTPIAELPATVVATDNVSELFPAGYAALRRGDNEAAAAAFKKSRALLSPEMFDYLINDPAIRRYSEVPAMREFYQ